MKLYWLALDVTPLTGKIIITRLKWYVALCILDRSIVRNWTSNL